MTPSPTTILQATRELDRALSRHGYFQSRASEFVISKPCAEASLSGDHARFMCERIHEYIAAGDIDRAVRWLCFVEGVAWVLGVFTLEEIISLTREESD